MSVPHAAWEDEQGLSRDAAPGWVVLSLHCVLGFSWTPLTDCMALLQDLHDCAKIDFIANVPAPGQSPLRERTQAVHCASQSRQGRGILEGVGLQTDGEGLALRTLGTAQSWAGLGYAVSRTSSLLPLAGVHQVPVLEQSSSETGQAESLAGPWSPQV